MKYGIQSSGLSVPVVWFLSTGLHVQDPKKQARYELECLSSLELGMVQTSQDVQVLVERIARIKKYIPDSEIPPLMLILCAQQEEKPVELAEAA